MKTDTAVEISDMWFSYNGGPVLRDVNLSIDKGEFTAVIGPNGGGKTTLLKLMLGLLKPDRGCVKILGRSPHDAVQKMGYVPQDIGMSNHFPISVMDVVMMGRLKTRKGWTRYSRADRAAARKALDAVELSEYGRNRIGELSGGQRQRVYIARALAGNPEILFLDEPTSGVDAKHQSDFHKLLKQLNDAVTILVVSHDVMVVSAYVKSVACVNGTVHFHGGAEVTSDMTDMYSCPVEIIAHGLPHRVLHEHAKE